MPYRLHEQPNGSVVVEVFGLSTRVAADLSVDVLPGDNYGGVPYDWLLTRARGTGLVTDLELQQAARAP